MNALAAIELAASAPVAAASGDWSETYDRFSAMEERFTPFQIAAMQFENRHTVLDVGAGSGRLALPVAQIVKSVTALDSSRRLLDQLEHSARETAQRNIVTLEKDWDTARPGHDVPRHDVVIASRYTGERDLLKLDEAANELVYIIMFAGPSTRALHTALLEDISEPPIEEAVLRPGVVTLVEELSELGIEPNVTHVSDGFTRWYRDEKEALAEFDWLDVDPALKAILNRNIRRFLQPAHGGVRFLFETRSALVWWRK